MQNFSKLDDPAFLSSVFHPRRSEITPLPKGAIDVEIETSPGIRIGCRFYIHDLNSPNVIYFHGNGEIVSDYDDIGPLYNHTGINLLVTTYRGYGWSVGSPTVELMLSDAEILFSKIQNWLTFNEYIGALFLMGRSLGSVSAIDLATRHEDDIKGLIIESGIANTIPLAEAIGVDTNRLGVTEADGFQNVEKIAKVTVATFIFHGSNDEIIAASEAENLQAYSGARTKEFVVIPGATHNTMILTGGKLYFQTLKNFIDKVTGITNWRRRRKTTNNYTPE
jgi:alpha-beta hydrolase superfamily lysophospholipase